MDSVEDEEFEEDFFLSKKKKERLKEELLDKDFKKALSSGPYKGIKKPFKKSVKKKPFLKFGIFLIIMAFICILIVNLSPWLYVRYGTNDSPIEELYYRDFDNKKSIENTNISLFFKSQDSSTYLGVSFDDFINIPRNSVYIFITIIILGFIFTLIEILNHWKNFSSVIRSITHTFFALLVSIICIYLLYINLHFFSSNILEYNNIGFIKDSLPNVSFVFITPVVLIFIVALILKISFSVMKLNFREFETIYIKMQPKKALYSYRYRGKDQ
jgi:hypothetical protein